MVFRCMRLMLKKFGTKTIVVKDNNKVQTLITLDGNKHEISNNEILITNGTDAMALGGIMGLENSMIDENTTEVILVASFDKKTTTNTSKN